MRANRRKKATGMGAWQYTYSTRTETGGSWLAGGTVKEEVT